MMRVAIVDDDPIVCSSLSTILKATGTADIAWTAYDGETAVGQYEEDNPDEEEQKEKNVLMFLIARLKFRLWTVLPRRERSSTPIRMRKS